MNLSQSVKSVFHGVMAVLFIFTINPAWAKPTNSSVKTELSAPQIQTININTATAEELKNGLKGIGLKKAQAIVEYREQKGKFTSIEQIKEVKGIGEKLFEKIKDYISI